MSKGQSRKGKEDRKPKMEKPKVVAAPPTSSGTAMLAAINSPKKKK